MEKIAVFGGTFNPIHNGHLHLASQYWECLGVNRLLFIPTFVPPHKRAPNLVNAEERLAMCRLSCAGTPFEASDMEIRRGGASYTSDTLLELREAHPQSRLYLLMGEDMFLTVENWHKPQLIYSFCTLCAAPRSPYGMERLREHTKKLEAMGATVILQDIAFLPVSSTMVREAVARGEEIAGLVPPGVANYIAGHGLYRAGEGMEKNGTEGL